MQHQQHLAHNRGVEKKRAQLQAFVDRFRAKASIASRAQSKLKQMQRLKTIEIGHPAGRVRIPIPPVEPKAGTGFTAVNLAIGYPERTVASGLDLEVARGQRVAILGDNGEGKSTLMKTLAGVLPPRGGSFRWAHGLECAYYAQHVFASLNPEDDVYLHLARNAARTVTRQRILDMAGGFLFKGDDVKKKVGVLSGGERARLVLAGLLLSQHQVLLLDEPTNHLDFETVEALGRALRAYGGMVFFISHDRTFVNLVATSILEIKSGNVRRYPGSYEDYVDHLERMARGEEGEREGEGEAEEAPLASEKARTHPERPRGGPGSATAPDPRALAAAAAAEKKQLREETSAAKKAVARAEKLLDQLARERDQLIEEIAAKPFGFCKDRNKRLKELHAGVVRVEHEWCRLQEKLDTLLRQGPSASSGG